MTYGLLTIVFLVLAWISGSLARNMFLDPQFTGPAQLFTLSCICWIIAAGLSLLVSMGVF